MPESHESVRRRVGVWICGAHGNVSVCAIAGAAAVARGLVPTTGLVTETRELAGLGLTPLDDLVFGGHEIREGTLVDAARQYGERNGLLTPALIAAVEDVLVDTETRVRPGALLNPGDEVRGFVTNGRAIASPPRDLLARIGADLRAFQADNDLDAVVVVNLTSTEAWPTDAAALESLDAFRAAVDADALASIPASALYAFAAVDAGFPFIDFTPSPAAGLAPVRELAQLRGVPHMGRDGKTGETLVKTVLAPMFLARNLRVMSWDGSNLLGNRDGEVLRDSGALQSKVRDKDDALRRILGDDAVHSSVRIDYVPSLQDWKQAYDFIHFEGFLGAKMQMHFLWQGCDSALASPLVLDLVRLADLAQRRGEIGTLPQLGCFFKTPIDVAERDFASQWARLAQYADEVRAESVDVDAPAPVSGQV